MTKLRYNPEIEAAIAELASLLKGEYGLSSRTVALMLLQEDAEIEAAVRAKENDAGRPVLATLAKWREALGQIAVQVQSQRAAETRRLAALTLHQTSIRAAPWRERLDRLTIHPLWGVPILALVLVGLYELVGVFGAGTLVGWLEDGVFGQLLTPWVNGLIVHIPFLPLRELIGGDYGLITLGLRYAVAIVLPIVGTFFLAFAVIEDSGYLPRLAYLMDSAFKKIGLSGRAVIPMTLGFGCGTLATMVSRTLETRRERIIATFLLALAIPCSAQLGVILGLLAGRPLALAIWASIVLLVFLLIGVLANQVLPGERAGFYIELPPLRLPKPGNIAAKTLSRMHWYFLEVVPLFLLASVLIWIGRMTGLFDILIRMMRPLVALLGLPGQAAQTFLFGFFRRDYGAAGLYDLERAHLLTSNQIVVAAVTMTLFVPCVAQFSIMVKERGWKTAAVMAGFIFPFAFLVGFILNQTLRVLGVSV